MFRLVKYEEHGARLLFLETPIILSQLYEVRHTKKPKLLFSLSVGMSGKQPNFG